MKIYYDIDKTSLIESVKPIAAEFTRRGEEYQKLYDDVQKFGKVNGGSK